MKKSEVILHEEIFFDLDANLFLYIERLKRVWEENEKEYNGNIYIKSEYVSKVDKSLSTTEVFAEDEELKLGSFLSGNRIRMIGIKNDESEESNE